MNDDSAFKHYKRFLMKWNSTRRLKKEKLTVILSPHMDDVFLSLNSLLSNMELGKNVIGINVFTVTDSLVETNLEGDFETLVNASLTRMKEELSYAKYLQSKKINYLPVFLGFKDAAVESYYRFIAGKKIRNLPSVLGIEEKARNFQWKYVRRQYAELGIERAIVQVIEQFGGAATEVLAPIGIGDHIDHMMLRFFAERMSNKYKIGLYADIPYIHEYGYDSIEKLSKTVPQSFKRYDRKGFDASDKTLLFKRLYRSQYEKDMLKTLFEISNSTGEVVFWK